MKKLIGLLITLSLAVTLVLVSAISVAAVSATTITGVVSGVNCEALEGITMELKWDGVVEDTYVSDVGGNYTLIASELGDYTVWASGEDYISESQNITAEGNPITLNFCGGSGLIPNKPRTSYLVASIHAWLHPELGCILGTPKLVSVIHYWRHPVE